MGFLGLRAPRTAVVASFTAILLIAGSFTLAAAQDRSGAAASELPEPFRNWDVQIEPHADNPDVLDLVFDSPLLKRRITNRVYLPSKYRPDGPALPVMYYLHGTIEPALDNPLVGPVTQHEALLDAIGPGGGARQTDIFHFEEQRDRAQFLLVAPDSSYENTICETCIWIDGRTDPLPAAPPATAETLPADSFLHQELYPLVEALFNVRDDRGGRGVMGFSMGGVAAYLQGMRHPDQYGLTASISGALDVVDEPGVRAIWESLGYMRDQGYGAAATNEADWRGFNPIDLASNLSGIDQPVFSSTGDACLSPSSLAHEDCVRLPPATNPAAASVEALLARQYALHSRVLPAKGVTETRAQRPGVHGANNHRVYAENVVPLANSVFEREVQEPETFRYRSTATELSVWGYDLSVERSTVEFLDLTDARRDGRSFQLRGSGAVRLLTPPTFEPGETYQIATTADDGTTSASSVVADTDGRLPVLVDLGRGQLADQVLEPTGVSPARSVTVEVS